MLRAAAQIIDALIHRRVPLGGLGYFARNFEFSDLNCAMRLEFAQSFLDFHDENEMRERAEARRFGAPPPHVEYRATLHARARTHGSLVGSSGKHGHTGQTMG